MEDCNYGDCGGSLELDYCGVCDGDNVANECEAPSCAADEFDCLGDGTECIFTRGRVICDWVDLSNGADEANCGGEMVIRLQLKAMIDSTGYGDTCSGWYDLYEGPGSAGTW